MTGAHLRAEIFDRPIAYRLRDHLNGAIVRCGAERPVVVCSDIWWLNNDAFRHRPTIAVGSPDVNALTAYMADKLPYVFSIKGRLGVQMDLDLVERIACCWGVDHAQTAAAVQAFEERYLDHFAADAAKDR